MMECMYNGMYRSWNVWILECVDYGMYGSWNVWIMEWMDYTSTESCLMYHVSSVFYFVFIVKSVRGARKKLFWLCFPCKL